MTCDHDEGRGGGRGGSVHAETPLPEPVKAHMVTHLDVIWGAGLKGTIGGLRCPGCRVLRDVGVLRGGGACQEQSGKRPLAPS